jgi:methionyl-tRNA synthetase
VVEGAASDLPAVVEDVARRYDEHLSMVELTQGVAAVWELIGRANQYLVEMEPWKAVKEPARQGEVASVLYAAAETLRVVAILISPVMPRAAGRLWEQLGIEAPLAEQRLTDASAWGGLRPGARTRKGGSLFPRLES